jgi:hypothetical protein
MRFKHHSDIYTALGLNPLRHIPVGSVSEQSINVSGRGEPPLVLPVYILPPTPGHRSHRVIAICSCGRHIPTGRLGQHWRTH